MKKVFAFLLILVVFLCSSGFYLAFYLSLHAQKQYQKSMIAAGKEDNELLLRFSFSNDDIAANNNNISFENDYEEMDFRGNMYDIISLKNNGDSIFITCIRDGKEDEILSRMGNTDIKMQKERTNNDLLHLKWRLDNFTFSSSFLFLQNVYFNFNKIIITSNKHLPMCYFQVPSPPPWNSFA